MKPVIILWLNLKAFFNCVKKCSCYPLLFHYSFYLNELFIRFFLFLLFSWYEHHFKHSSHIKAEKKKSKEKDIVFRVVAQWKSGYWYWGSMIEGNEYIFLHEITWILTRKKLEMTRKETWWKMLSQCWLWVRNNQWMEEESLFRFFWPYCVTHIPSSFANSKWF